VQFSFILYSDKRFSDNLNLAKISIETMELKRECSENHLKKGIQLKV